MNRTLPILGLLLAAGCSSSSSPAISSGDDASDSGGSDGSSSEPDSTTPAEGGNPGTDSGGDAGTRTDAAADASDSSVGPDSSDVGDGGADASPDADAAALCSGAWLDAPTVAALALPDGGVVILHAVGTGTQDYACVGTPIDGGADAGDAGESFAWTLTGPDAVLTDCNGQTIGHHFPSEAGATAPEWQTTDGTYVIGHKMVTYTPDGGGASVPWLLLNATAHGGSGTLSGVTFVQRLDTDGGVAPATGCDQGSVGATTNVGYTADYYFFGP
jgi:hypothetical protein